VFLDVEAIGAGEDLVAAIERAIWEADVVLVLIGPGGSPRLTPRVGDVS
jgi:hypothetical protein